MSTAASRSYHHGDLRSALLERAEEVLRTTGVRGLSLRELARDVGVSHSAPRRHFADKDALLTALAEEGFHRLGRTLADALQGDDGAAGGFEARLLAFARAYVGFATRHGALLDLMFADKHKPGATGLQQAATQAFDAPLQFLADAQRSGDIVPGDPERIGMGVVASLHGIAAMTNSGILEAAAVNALLDDLVRQLVLGLRPR